MTTVVQVLLKRVKVIENGEFEPNVDGDNKLIATLFYPREGIPALTSMRSLELEDEVAFDYSTKPISERLLFKEVVRGSTMLEFSLTAIDAPSKFEKLFSKVVVGALKTAVGAIPGAGKVLTAATTMAVDTLFDSNGNDEEKVTIIGKGALPITADTDEGEIAFQLAVPREVTLSKTILNADGLKETHNRTLEEGFVNAEVVVDFSRIAL